MKRFKGCEVDEDYIRYKKAMKEFTIEEQIEYYEMLRQEEAQQKNMEITKMRYLGFLLFLSFATAAVVVAVITIFCPVSFWNRIIWTIICTFVVMVIHYYKRIFPSYYEWRSYTRD